MVPHETNVPTCHEKTLAIPLVPCKFVACCDASLDVLLMNAGLHLHLLLISGTGVCYSDHAFGLLNDD